MKKAIFAWSGGKDSAFALHKIQLEGEFEILGLMTTLNKNFKRISMHGVKENLLDEQAASIGIPLIKMWVEEGTKEIWKRYF
jgi:diphthamide synthase (EF-2-diphthine--ammonia ligase)